jgi:sec-independent protein translocase protein TatB
MFTDLSWSHILLLLVVALVVVGPKDLPKLMRKLGQWTAKARAMADQFRSSFDEMARQSELDELRKEIEELRKIRPLAETEKQVTEALKLPDISLGTAAPTTAEITAAESPTAESLAAVPAASSAEAFVPPTVESTAEALAALPPIEPPAEASEPAVPHEGGVTPPVP